MSPIFLPSTNIGVIIHALPVSDNPPPVTENTSVIKHGRWVDADMVNATRLEPQQLHVVMIMLMVTRMAMIGLLYMMLNLLVLVIPIVMVMIMLMVTTVGMAGLVQPV